ncbi:MAG: hypothetical protein LUH00_12775 [Lachnospiraceae bacterium]|nr:hypothetical protein [Lachnospiraceae bacterium]
MLSNGTVIGAENETYYVALYEDEDCTILASEVMALNYSWSSSATVSITGLEVGKTYYISECDASGNAVILGTTADGTIYTPEYNGANTFVLENENSSVTASFANEYYDLPDQFYYEGYLTITKKLLGVDGDPLYSDAVFYAGIFDDASYTTLSSRVDVNIVELNLAGGAEVSQTIPVSVSGDEAVTLYVTEVDANGNPIAGTSGFLYTVTVDGSTVTLDSANLKASVVITNQEYEIVEEESSEYEESESETESTAVKTGDDTPIAPYMSLMILALGVLLLGDFYRKKRAEE